MVGSRRWLWGFPSVSCDLGLGCGRDLFGNWPGSDWKKCPESLGTFFWLFVCHHCGLLSGAVHPCLCGLLWLLTLMPQVPMEDTNYPWAQSHIPGNGSGAHRPPPRPIRTVLRLQKDWLCPVAVDQSSKGGPRELAHIFKGATSLHYPESVRWPSYECYQRGPEN